MSPLGKYTRPDFSKAALLTIDMQNDFCLPGFAAPTPGGQEIIAPLTRLAAFFRERNLPLFHVVRLYTPDGENADVCRREAIENGLSFVAPGTKGADVVDGLLPEGARIDAERLLSGLPQPLSDCEAIFYKPRWGAFHGTRFEGMLAARGINTLLVTGTFYPNCVRTTIMESTSRDLRTVVVPDCIAGIYERGVTELSNIGCAVMDSSEIMEAMRGN